MYIYNKNVSEKLFTDLTLLQILFDSTANKMVVRGLQQHQDTVNGSAELPVMSDLRFKDESFT